MPDSDIYIQDKRYYSKIKGIRSFCEQVIAAAWHAYEPAEISLVLTNDAAVQALNKEHRGRDVATNVLSFETNAAPVKGLPWLAGDVFVAYETVLKEAKDQEKTFESHLAHLLLHGVLHLQGYDHIDLKQAQKMEKLETQLMLQLGYEDPYKDFI